MRIVYATMRIREDGCLLAPPELSCQNEVWLALEFGCGCSPLLS